MESTISSTITVAQDPKPTQSEDVSQLHPDWASDVAPDGAKVGEWNGAVWAALYRWLQAQRRDLLWGMFRKVKGGEGTVTAITCTLGEGDPADVEFDEEWEEFDDLPGGLKARVEEAMVCTRGLQMLAEDDGAIIQEELSGWLERWKKALGEGGTEWEDRADRLLLGIE